MEGINKKKARAIVTLLLLAAIILLAGLPQSPFSVIKNIKKKSARLVELILPIDNLAKHLSVDLCTKESLENLYDSKENFNPAKSGLNIFKSRLAKEYKIKNFNNLAIRVLAGNLDSSTTSKTCLLPLKAGTESSLAVSLENQPITEVALGKQSVFCSKDKAYLLDDRFYHIETVIKGYAKQIKDKKTVITLKKQLSELKARKARLSKSKKTERLKLDKDIRRVSLSISYAQYFSKEAELLASFYNSVCAQLDLNVTPNSKPVVPTEVITSVPSPTAIATAIRTVIPTSSSIRISAPSLLSPAASNTLDTIHILPEGSSSITISWNRVEYKPGSARYLVRAVDLSNNSSILSSVNPDNYSYESITLSGLQAGRKYRFWLHSAKEKVDYSNGSNTYSAQVDFFFSVSGSSQIAPAATPTAIVSATATIGTPNSDYRVGDRIQLIKVTNVRSSAGLNGNLLGQQQITSAGTIVSGPMSMDNITWWNVNFDNGVDGYCGEDNYRKIIPECSNGQTETRTFWEASSVPSGQSCKSEPQTWTCVNGSWQRSSGTYEYENCDVRPPYVRTCTFIKHQDITWTFRDPAGCGEFANGEPWVIGRVVVTSISPAPTTVEGFAVNGSMINPIPAQRQGFSAYVRPAAAAVMSEAIHYDSSKNAALRLPLTLQNNDVLVSSKHGGWPADQGGRQFLESIAALTVLPSVPPEGSFRPGIYGTDRTVRWNVDQINWDILKNFVPVAATPNTAYIYSEMPNLPWFEWTQEWDGWYLQPQKNTADGSLRGDPVGLASVYGRDTSFKFGEVGLWLNTKQNINDKKAIAIRMIQNGLDIWSYLQFSGAGFLEDGGHKAGRKLPLVMAAAMLNDGNQLLEGKASNPTIFQEDRQIWFVTQSDVGRLVQDPVREKKCYPDVPLNQQDSWCGREFLTYRQEDVGMAEWGIRHSRNQYEDNRSWGATYRHTVFPAMISPILTAELMGLKSIWNHQAEFAYMERFYNATNGSLVGPYTFVKQMYTKYKLGQ